MTIKDLATCLVVALATLSAAQVDAGTVVFDNLGSGYEPYGNWVGTVYFPDPGLDVTAICATDFTPTHSGKLSAIWAALVLESGQNTFTLSLLADNANEPGTVLWSQTFQNRLSVVLGSVFHAGNGSVPIVNAPDLVAGTRYWLQAEAPVQTGQVVNWYTNSAGDLGSTGILFSDIGSWQMYNNDTRPGFTVEVLPAPAALPAGLALMGFMGLRRRRA